MKCFLYFESCLLQSEILRKDRQVYQCKSTFEVSEEREVKPFQVKMRTVLWLICRLCLSRIYRSRWEVPLPSYWLILMKAYTDSPWFSLMVKWSTKFSKESTILSWTQYRAESQVKGIPSKEPGLPRIKPGWPDHIQIKNEC